MIHSIEATKILDTTVGYLLGGNEQANLFKDTKMLQRLQDISNLPDKKKESLITNIDYFIKAAKINIMGLSIFNIANGISWTDQEHFYLTQKEDKYELIIDYLNSANIENLKNDISRLKTFQTIRNSNNKQEIEDYIMNEIEGFNDREDGYSAYLAGAQDKSASIHYNIEHDIISLIHPNISTLGKFIIEPNELIGLASQMIEIISMKDTLKFGEN